jgi:hypothetical protein
MRPISSTGLTVALISALVGASTGCASEGSAIRPTSHAPSVVDRQGSATQQAAVVRRLEAQPHAPASSPRPESVSATRFAVGTPMAQVIVGPPPPPQPEHQHFMLLLGERRLDDSFWGALDDQFSVGFTFDKQSQGAPVALDLGIYYSDDSTTTVTGLIPVLTDLRADVLEFNIGALKMFGDKPGGLKPYVGAGLALSWVSARAFRLFLVDDTDFTPGVYGRAGLAVQTGGGAMFGIDFHYLGATSINLAGENANIDGWIASVMFGMGF